MTPEMIAKFNAHREAVIAEHGWMVQMVFPTEQDPDHNHFQYTVGLHSRGLPELVSIGLPGEVAHMLINDVVQVIAERKAAGLPLVGQVDHDNWPMPFYLVTASTPKAEELATGARNRSQGQASYLQVCWPDAAGRFPWYPGTEESYRQAQPLLGKPMFLN